MSTTLEQVHMQTAISTAKSTGTDQERREAVLRQLWLQDISVRTKDDFIALSGVVRTLAAKMAAGQAAKSIYV